MMKDLESITVISVESNQLHDFNKVIEVVTCYILNSVICNCCISFPSL